ncbi:MAG: flavin reductase family protein, partial [Halobacteriovoraceae bacterium]|nr:flavin reductase family protein [Halobacteriovoraceae bacterium]
MSEKATAVGHIPSGLFIVSVNKDDQKDGYLASWVQQVSFDPLIVAFTIKSDRPGYEAIVSGT